MFTLSREERLSSFLKTLDDKGILSFNKNLFNNRLKVQKYVFIARKFGLSLRYTYSLYIRGPYSSGLADDYYEIDDYHNSNSLEIDEDFFKLVKNKSEEWLELAATILMIRERYQSINDEKLVALVNNAKPHAKKEELRKILVLLRKYSCLNCVQG